MIFNEISNKNNQDYKSYSDLITDKIMQFARRTTGIETPSETYSTPETNLAYRDAIQLINRKMATGRLLIVGKPQMTHSEKCEELIEFMKGVNETHENLETLQRRSKEKKSQLTAGLVRFQQLYFPNS